MDVPVLQILEMEDLSVVAGQLGLYFMTVLIGLFTHGFVVLPIIFTVCTRQWPFRRGSPEADS